MTLRCDPPLVGVTLIELAERHAWHPERAAALVAPFLDAGIVEERDGLLVVVDPLVASAFAQMEDQGA